MGRAVSLGIDLGTTETVAYAINGEKTVPVKLSSSKHSLPSVVCRTLEGEWLVGEPALSHKRVHPDRVLLYKTKRLIGKTYGEAVSEGILRGLHYEVTEGTGPNEGKPVFNIGACLHTVFQLFKV